MLEYFSDDGGLTEEEQMDEARRFEKYGRVSGEFCVNCNAHFVKYMPFHGRIVTPRAWLNGDAVCVRCLGEEMSSND